MSGDDFDMRSVVSMCAEQVECGYCPKDSTANGIICFRVFIPDYRAKHGALSFVALDRMPKRMR